MFSLENLPANLAQVIVSHAESAAFEACAGEAGVMPRVSSVQRSRDLLQKLDKLPAAKHVEPLLHVLSRERKAIVVGETGTGKSTVLPLLVSAQYPKTEIIVAVPRITAAQRLADWISQVKGDEVGNSVGYHTGESRALGPKTKLIYCTTGIAVMRDLLRHKKQDRIVFLDEAHERNIDQDLLLAFLRAEMRTNPRLHVVVMSATIQADRFSQYFSGAKQIHILGRGFPITQLPPKRTLGEDVSHLVRLGLNIQIGVPGKLEIEQAMNEVEQALSAEGLTAELLPLHKDVPAHQQQLCFQNYPIPRIVFSTNVGESSLTLPDNHAVIDLGFRRRVFVRDGVQFLDTALATQFEALQLRGRTGRTGPGIWIDRCPVELEKRQLAPTPEIQRVLPLSAFLRCVALQGTDPRQLTLMDDPGRAVWDSAEDEGKMLGLIDSGGQATEFGKKVALLRVSPNFGRMLIAARQEHMLREAIIVASAIEAEGLHDRQNSAWRTVLAHDDPESALTLQLKLFHLAEQLSERGATQDEFEEVGISRKNFEKARTNVAETMRRVRDFGWVEVDKPSRCRDVDSALVRCFLQGFPNRVFVRSNDSYVGLDGQQRTIHPQEIAGSGSRFIVGIPFDFCANPAEFGGRPVHYISFATPISETAAKRFPYVREILDGVRERSPQERLALRAPQGKLHARRHNVPPSTSRGTRSGWSH